ncbi:COG4315 family predicted lipoprotein [Conexibacter arvalis]|uniref:Putative lipoprotein with Yx(FWY)xxD motif n=1 Tax=Conexibacter arvalis TaxID=912552 RepID=A0A840I9B4_9ACTN|nr:hypothetical protein [Conexibacter arvalis]MBB4660905.1 putative lipoprotein with Yx(FWY)xxD motif [Conexibacter arvalis]
MRRLIILAAALAAAALIAAGCGSSGGSSTGGSTTGGGSSGAGTSSAASGGGSYGYGGAMTQSTTTRPASGGAAVVKTASTPLGTILVDGGGRTLYLFERDTTSTSTCDGACAAEWPPLTTSGRATAAGKASTARLGTTRRADGTTEVTYAGHPLYRYAGDAAPGDTHGQNIDAFGAEWYVLAPSGTAVTGHGS